MKNRRPSLLNFFAIKTTEHLSIRASIAWSDINGEYTQTTPLKNLTQFTKNKYCLKIIGLNSSYQEIFTDIFESSIFGNFDFRIPISDSTKNVVALQVFELTSLMGIEQYMGTFLPLELLTRKKIIISDFDKTLVDTKYSTIFELIKILSGPLNRFITLKKSVAMVNDYIRQGYHPFIVSASPHFFENPIRDWLYQNKIYTAGIFLKDYREIFSIVNGLLSPKDMTVHGLYKLYHILDILLMTGIPDDLILIGDNFESDPHIYLTVAKILQDDPDPHAIWNTIKQETSFRLTKSQHSKLLGKFFQLKDMRIRRKQYLKGNDKINLKIFIRRKSVDDSIDNKIKDLEDKLPLITLYDG